MKRQTYRKVRTQSYESKIPLDQDSRVAKKRSGYFATPIFRWGSFLFERNAVTNKGVHYLVAKIWL